ncbi:hypothetical protein CARN8_7210002 [mine drainage metagenome]|uniref:Uncharacterized protein n=1 Tax=mine drainage metagenome TaxID=410659 RepID=A0A3P3ZRZ4_9ZZZZ
MTCICPVITLSPRDYDAVLFDLDGVLTKSASVHASAWKKLFDEFLTLDLRLTRDALRVRGRDDAAPPISLCVEDNIYEFVSGTARVFRLSGEAKGRFR